MYLNQGESPDIEGVKDSDTFDETIQALNILGFSRSDQENIFKVLAAILHLGNVVVNKEDESCSVKVDIYKMCIVIKFTVLLIFALFQKDDRHLKIFCDLLELNADQMRLWLCCRKIVSMKEVFNKPMSLQEVSSDCP